LRLDLALVHAGSVNPATAGAAGSVVENKTPSKILRAADLGRLERENIVAALEHSRWKISGPGGAAELVGMNPNTLASRMRSLGIKRSRT